MAGERILIVEDNTIVAKDLQSRIQGLEYEVVGVAVSGEEAVRHVEEFHPDLVLMDIHLKGKMDGIKAAEQIRKHVDIPVIYLTGYGDKETVERAKVTEPFGYILKPWGDRDLEVNIAIALHEHRMKQELKKYRNHLEDLVEERTAELVNVNAKLSLEIEERKRAEEELRQLKEQLQKEIIYLQEEIQLEHNFSGIIGNSEGLRYILFRVEQIASSDTTVLILGETGTGKELIARAIHHTSPLKARPLIKVNCAALPSHLIESELFGHEKGAFTGAATHRIGRFELADGATLFLDEIGELPLDLQAKLLRVIEEGAFERVGSSRTIKMDVRIIAATNRNLEAEMQAGRFREDLFYRLNVYTLSLPPLRERREDIPLLVQAFVHNFNKKLGKSIHTIPQKTMDTLQAYSWPGNVRELENAIEKAVIIAQDTTLRVELPQTTNRTCALNKTLDEVERKYIQQVLEAKRWRIEGPQGAAVALGLHPSTLRFRMRKLGVTRPT